MIDIISSIWRKRELILEMSRRELFGGHGGHLLGGVWVFVNPLLMVLSYYIVFHFIFPSRLPEGGDSDVFLLAGLIQWIVLSEMIVRSCTVLQGHMNLVRQINFPLETLFAKTVVISLFIQVVMTLGLLLLIGLLGTGFDVESILLWLLAMCVQSVFMMGAALILGSATPFLPDLNEIVGVFARLGLFVTPILYQAERFGPKIRAGFYLNPFSWFAWIHQDALSSGAIERPTAWIGAASIAVLSLLIGTKLFKALRHSFADVL
jgi:lipopolysaccharide transport system permease protein